MMGMSWWWIDGAFTRAAPPEPLPFALLETIGAVKGMLPLWDRHVTRLLGCAQRLQRPAVLPPEAQAGAIELLARNEQPDGVLRMLFTARGTLALTTRPRADAGVVRLIPVLARAPADAPPPDLKTSDRRHYDAALLEARAGGADDGVLLGQGGTVLETAIANLWLLLDGVWTTPPADGAILPGIARALLLERARTQGMAVAERRCELGDLHRATALAVSNAVVGVCAAALAGGPPGSEPVALQSLWRS
jgi:branched-subunit amino acid aminotransferase/4-amino-4-deoxychorismate lyase